MYQLFSSSQRGSFVCKCNSGYAPPGFVKDMKACNAPTGTSESESRHHCLNLSPDIIIITFFVLF